MIDKLLRSPKESLLSPIARRSLRSVHPTTITILAFGLGVLCAAAAWLEYFALALLLWLLNRVLDGIDGTIARLHRKQSDLGGYLDMMCDTVIYALIPLALALTHHSTAGYLSLALLLGSFYINAASWMYLAALLEKRRSGAARHGELTTITMPGGLIEGAETIIFFCLFLLFPAAMVPLFVFMAPLVVFTAAQRWIWAARHLLAEPARIDVLGPEK